MVLAHWGSNRVFQLPMQTLKRLHQWNNMQVSLDPFSTYNKSTADDFKSIFGKMYIENLCKWKYYILRHGESSVYCANNSSFWYKLYTSYNPNLRRVRFGLERNMRSMLRLTGGVYGYWIPLHHSSPCQYRTATPPGTASKDIWADPTSVTLESSHPYFLFICLKEKNIRFTLSHIQVLNLTQFREADQFQS